MKFEELRVKEIHGVLRYRPNIPRWISRDRKNHIIGIQLSGSALHIMESQSFVMSGGCVYFLNQRDDYRVEVYEAGEALSIHFTTYEEIDSESFCFSISNTHEVVSLLQKAEKCKTVGNELKLLALLYEICDTFEKLRVKTYAHRDVRMIAAKNEMDQRFTQPDCMETVIRHSNLGDRRFRDLFRQMFDVTPNQYITLKKIEYAQNLLSAGGISVTEVSELCGFADVYYFSKVFKQMCGVTPSAWK